MSKHDRALPVLRLVSSKFGVILPQAAKGGFTERISVSSQTGFGYRFNWSTQHKLEIVQRASRSLESFGVVH
jgi:hypothetical protein